MAGFTPGPWRWEFIGTTGNWALVANDRLVPIGGPPDVDPNKGDMALIAAAPDLLEAAEKHIEWIEKERRGPDYGGLTRDTHPNGEAIWRAWWDEQLDLCAATEALCRAAIAKARGEVA